MNSIKSGLYDISDHIENTIINYTVCENKPKIVYVIDIQSQLHKNIFDMIMNSIEFLDNHYSVDLILYYTDAIYENITPCYAYNVIKNFNYVYDWNVNMLDKAYNTTNNILSKYENSVPIIIITLYGLLMSQNIINCYNKRIHNTYIIVMIFHNQDYYEDIYRKICSKVYCLPDRESDCLTNSIKDIHNNQYFKNIYVGLNNILIDKCKSLTVLNTDINNINNTIIKPHDSNLVCGIIIEYINNINFDNGKNYFLLYQNVNRVINKIKNDIDINLKEYILYKLPSLYKKIFDSKTTKNDIITIITNMAKSFDINMKYDRHKNMIVGRYINNVNKITQNFDDVVDYDIDEDDDDFESSCEFFNSFFSLSNWFDEIENGGALGLLMNMSTSPLGKLGFNYGVKCHYITDGYMPIEDYLVSILKYFNANDDDSCGNINNKNISNYNGLPCNTLMPIYINKYHWKSTKKYIPIMLGINLAHNPFGFTDKHNNIFFSTLTFFTKELLYNEKYFTDKMLTTYFAFLRTCMEVSIENKYNRGIYSIVNKFNSDPLSRILPHLDLSYVIIGQMLCSRMNGIDVDTFIENLIGEAIRQLLKTHKYKSDMLVTLFNPPASYDGTLKQYVCNELNLIIVYIHLRDTLMYITASYYMISIMESLYDKFGSYTQFIKHMEEKHSIIGEEYSNIVKNKLSVIRSNQFSLKTIYDVRDKYKNQNYIDKIYSYLLQGLEFIENKDKIDAINRNISYNQDFNYVYDEYKKIYHKDTITIKIESNGLATIINSGLEIISKLM